MALFDNLFAIAPYKCKCGAKFRWQSEFLQHRKKFRH